MFNKEEKFKLYNKLKEEFEGGVIIMACKGGKKSGSKGKGGKGGK